MPGAGGSPVCDLPAVTCAYADLNNLWPGDVALSSNPPQHNGYSWLAPNAVSCSLSRKAAAHIFPFFLYGKV